MEIMLIIVRFACLVILALFFGWVMVTAIKDGNWTEAIFWFLVLNWISEAVTEGKE